MGRHTSSPPDEFDDFIRKNAGDQGTFGLRGVEQPVVPPSTASQEAVAEVAELRIQVADLTAK
jgi:hypothetical protein